ncbi:MAG: hypothetical protein KA222_02720 [Pseudoxanthomonas sp.]|nr:hypothetical protein [Pseudoxanthomonas sp.]
MTHSPINGLQPWSSPEVRCFGSVQDLTAGGTALAKEADWCPTPELGCYPHYQRP